ncbi:MAG: hypothetical protein AMK72_02260 [Planctomycetes bacterium SM23_25]|nr:MAG: hypothetical protein AMK72_02260 [Planctomycetes bacterium SM23_25]
MVRCGRVLASATCLVVLLAAGAASEAPAPTAPATPAPATPAPAAPAPAGPKEDAVLSFLPDTDGVHGGKVTFSAKAFPVVADGTEPQVQGLLRTARPLPCRTCRSTGKVGRKQSYVPSGAGFQTPIVKRWDETCSTCGGYGNLCDPKLPMRLLLLVDRLAHVARGDLFAKLLSLAEERLTAVFEVRDKTWDTFRCEKVMGYRSITYVDPDGHRRSRSVRTVVGLKVVRDQARSLRVNVGSMVASQWREQEHQPPAGQAALLVGTTSDKAEVGGWVWMKMAVGSKGRAAGKGGKAPDSGPPDAILLCGTPKTCTVPVGRAAVGGLVLGTWTAAGRDKQGGVPVILAVVSVAGR